MKKGIYKNIIELAKENDLYNTWTNECSGTLEDYLDDYSDRDIVHLFLRDMTPSTISYKIYKKMDGNCIDWRNSKIEVY